MGKRGMQAKDAMGVVDLDPEFLGHKKIKNVRASINNLDDFDDVTQPSALQRASAGVQPDSTTVALAAATNQQRPDSEEAYMQRSLAKQMERQNSYKTKVLQAEMEGAPAPPPTITLIEQSSGALRKKKPSELVDAASSALNARYSDMFKAFQFIDLDRSGVIGEKELARALDLWNIPIDRQKIKELIAACDRNGDGEISYEEFVDMLARDTVANAAMGKRGMQAKDAMGVVDL